MRPAFVWCVAHPLSFRRVLLDDTDVHGRAGGGGYAEYGIDTHAGAIVVVRPDGYVGMVAPLGEVELVDAYFSAFLV